MIKLDIFSDPVCPWCLIGKAYLDCALASVPDHPFNIEWHPFQLNPDMPVGGMDRRDYLEAKFGGQMNAVQAYSRVMPAAEDAGVEINLEKITRQPNTMDAHRLIHWAGLEGRQTAMVSALFQAYFREGRDIGDPETLVALAGTIGMDTALTERLLATDADRDLIATRDRHARERGVSAVPTFLLANQYVLAGAQPVKLWRQVMDELAASSDQTGSGKGSESGVTRTS